MQVYKVYKAGHPGSTTTINGELNEAILRNIYKVPDHYVSIVERIKPGVWIFKFASEEIYICKVYQ